MEIYDYIMGAIFISFFPLVRLIEKNMEKKKLAPLLKREPLDAQKFYNRFYKDSDLPEDFVVGMHDVLRKYLKPGILHTGINADYLRPDDRFRDIFTAKYSALGSDTGRLFEDTETLMMEITISLNDFNKLCNKYDEVKTIDEFLRFLYTIPNFEAKWFDNYI